MKINNFLFLLLLKLPVSIFSQDSLYHKPYFDSLKQELIQNNKIKEVKLYQHKYLNGRIKEQEMLVKYVNDTIDQYWIVGSVFEYYRNGIVRATQVFDIPENDSMDTVFYFYKSGRLQANLIYKNDNSSLVPYPRKRFHDLGKMVISNYKLIEFDEAGNKRAEIPFKLIGRKMRIDGTVVFYDSNGIWYQEDEFVKGIRTISTMAHPNFGIVDPNPLIIRKTDSICIGNCIDIIAKDSFRFYFKERDILVDKECADYFREVKMNTEAYVQNGAANDYNPYGRIIAASYYSNNVLNGPYKSFYLNGGIKESGEFKNGLKSGEWHYFNENNTLNRVILFNSGDLYLKEAYDDDGKQVIRNGEGEFCDDDILPGKNIAGDISNGKQNGKWIIKNKYSNPEYNMEYFSNGIFIEGQSLPLKADYNKKYTNSSVFKIDSFTDLLNLNYLYKSYCKEYGKSEQYAPKSFNADFGYLPFFDYIYQNFDPPGITSGYIIVGCSINTLGNIGKINSYSTIKNKSVEDELIKIFSSGQKWNPEILDDSPVVTSEIFIFQFFSEGYKILNDTRFSSPSATEMLSAAAIFSEGRDSLDARVFSGLNLPEEFYAESFNSAACFEFHIDQSGKIIDDNGAFINRLRVTENEKVLYEALKNALVNAGDWQPATYNNSQINHFFIAILNIKDGKPKLRLVSKNWVMN